MKYTHLRIINECIILRAIKFIIASGQWFELLRNNAYILQKKRRKMNIELLNNN